VSEPFNPEMIAKMLRNMTPDRLRETKPGDFHIHPAKRIVPTAVIQELIANERARRIGNG
jgi:hypothetical protein